MITALRICIIYKIVTLFGIVNIHTYDQDLPKLVWWTGHFFPHPGNTEKITCSKGSCVVSKKQQIQGNIPVAYLFYGTDFSGTDLPLPRLSNHVWALFHEESPMNNYIFSHSCGIKLFNYTSTFSRYSHFPVTTQFIPSIVYLLNRKPVPLNQKNKLRKNGTAPVLYLQSHCNVPSDRDRFIQKLSQFIQIDSYGTCLHNKDLPANLVSTETYNSEELMHFISKYKFHIAFENALCDDYITEKLFRVFHVGSVPIYKGSPSVLDWAPSNNSLILIDNFASPKELAYYLIEVDNNDTLYESFLKYKDDGITNEFLKEHLQKRTWGVNDPEKTDFIHSFECFVCDKLLENENVPTTGDKKHMDCPQPHMSIISDDEFSVNDEWVKEGWIDHFWYCYDQAKAIENMLEKGENSSQSFWKYLSNQKYRM